MVCGVLLVEVLSGLLSDVFERDQRHSNVIDRTAQNIIKNLAMIDFSSVQT